MSYNHQYNGDVIISGKKALQCISCRNHVVPRFAWQYTKPQEFICSLCFNHKCRKCGIINNNNTLKYFPKTHPLHKLCQTCINAYNTTNCGVCHIDTMPHSSSRCQAHYNIPVTKCVTCNKAQAQVGQKSYFDHLNTTTHNYCDDCRPAANAKNQKLRVIADKQRQIDTLKQRQQDLYETMFYPGLVVDLSYILTFETNCTTTKSKFKNTFPTCASDDDDNNDTYCGSYYGSYVHNDDVVIATTLRQIVVKKTMRLPMSINDESYINKFTGELNINDLPDSYQSIDDGSDYAHTDDVFRCGNLKSAHVRRFEPISLTPTSDNPDIVAIDEQLKALETH